jgi:hypothetical protein
MVALVALITLPSLNSAFPLKTLNNHGAAGQGFYPRVQLAA